MANDVSVRSYLLGKGYSNDDIGYDQGTKSVQLKNKATGAYDNFMKPSMNVNGSTYDNQSNIDNAYNQYAKTQQQPAQVGQPTQPAQPQANPYMDQYTQMIKDIQTRLAAPQQDVYSTPQYAAAQAQQQRAAQQGIRSAQEALGSSGFGRSTTLGESANRVQNDANEYLNLQMVPQIQQQLAAQKQAEISNQFSLLNPIMSLLNRDDTLKQNEFSNNIAKAGVTGYYQPDNTDFDTIQKLMAQNSAAYGAASPEEQQRLHAENVKLAASIGGSDTTGNGDYAYGPMRTLQGQQMDYGQQKDERDFKYQTVQDAIQNGMSQQQIDNQTKQFAARLGYDYESMDANDKQAWAQIAISQQNANTSAANAANDNSLNREKFEFDKEQASNKSKTASDFYKELDSSMYIIPETTTDQFGKTSDTGKTVVSDPDGLENYIFSLELAPEETYKLLNRYKLVKK